ncbi:MAG: laccase domain-containing protein [Polaromonas sp.]|nr:laccase domain-containing protein [Polaromonas sp.]
MPLIPNLPPDWFIPQWPAPASVRAVFTTRQGGVSLSPFGTLNLGDHVGDVAAAVAANRLILQRAIACQPVFLQQVHGTGVLELSQSCGDGQIADACLTSQRGIACLIMVADCLPVLFAHLDQPVVAAAHAGWRGLAGPATSAQRDSNHDAAQNAFDGVLEATFRRFTALVGADCASVAKRTIAWLGPCIGPTAFEVGAEVKAAFEVGHPAAGAFFVPVPGQSHPVKFWADLPGLARLRLRALGITQIFGNDGSADWCTVSRPSRYFSHRRDAGGGQTTGRMAACIWRV